MPPLEPGTKAPDFALADQAGVVHRLSAHRGAPVVLFFYPRDGTEDCTLEACAFSAARGRFAKAGGAAIFGISRLDVKSKAKFAKKHAIDVPLLADESTEVAASYGVLREKSMYGKKYMGIDRTTFLIDASGVIARRWDVEDVAGHEAEVLATVKAGAAPSRGSVAEPSMSEAKPQGKEVGAKAAAPTPKRKKSTRRKGISSE